MLSNCRSPQMALLFALFFCAKAEATAPPAFRAVKSIDLAKPFGARTPWHLAVSRGPDVPPDQSAGGYTEPGEIRLCVSNNGGKSCASDLQARFHSAKEDDVFAEEDHYLDDTRFVYPRGRAAPPLFLIRTASLHGGNGSQRATLQILAYDKRSDRFHLAYDGETGGNMTRKCVMSPQVRSKARSLRPSRRRVRHIDMDRGEPAYGTRPLSTRVAIPERHFIWRRQSARGDRRRNAEYPAAAEPVAPGPTAAVAGKAVRQAAPDPYGIVVQVSRRRKSKSA